MPITSSIGSKPKKLLIITSSGGGGLIQTANAKEQEALAKDPHLVVVRRDLLKDWVWKPFGAFCIYFWNRAQIKGNIPAQMICFYGQRLVDFCIHPAIFCRALYTAWKEDVDYVIDTQPLGTSAILKALRIFNYKKKKNVRLEKVLVDLPTKKASHFFSPIKRLSPKSRKFLKLTTIAPLLEEKETAEQFWQQTCGLSEKEVNCEEVYVRQAFRKYKGKERSSRSMRIKMGYKNREELRLMAQTFERGAVCAKVQEREVEFQIDPEDQVITVLLGSQPAVEATLNYVRKMIPVIQECAKGKTDLFVFCADHKEGEWTLFRRVAEFVETIAQYSQNLSIIPFSFQSEHTIAPLFYRSDITCTRSGGQTAMELMCVSTGQIWIHSEAKKEQDILKGISAWEAQSAVYLQKSRGAKIVTPDIFVPHLRRFYTERDSKFGISSARVAGVKYG